LWRIIYRHINNQKRGLTRRSCGSERFK